jgi:hypothetical protein
MTCSYFPRQFGLQSSTRINTDPLTKLKDCNVTYPCRHVRFRAQVDISPDEDSRFTFPKDGECGSLLDLGEYRFSEDNNGVVLLEVPPKKRALLSVPEKTGGTLRTADGVVSRPDHLKTIQIQKFVGAPTRLQRLAASLEVMGRPVGKK